MVEKDVGVVALVGSPRPRGNSSCLVDAALRELESAGARTEKVMLGARKIGFCVGHDDCEEREDCPLEDDASALIDDVFRADGLILASPVYGDNVSAQMKVFMDRCCHPYNRGRKLRTRVVGLLAVADSSGLEETIDAMRRFVSFIEPDGVEIVTAAGYATCLGDAARNEPLVEEARVVGRRMAEALGLGSSALG